MNRLSEKITLFLKRNSATILTCIGSIGVVVTAVMAVKATPKAMKSLEESDHNLSSIEKIKMVAPIYIPSIAAGTGTIACIFGANILNTKSQASLMSAYALLEQSFKEYKNKVDDIYGEGASNHIQDEIVIANAKDISFECLCGSCNMAIEADSEEVLFYEPISRRYFRSNIEKVLLAEYHLNRNFAFRICSFLNEFYNFLGIEETVEGNSLGWVMEDGDTQWIDFNHRKVELEDGMECYIIEMPVEPTKDILDYHYW